MPLTFSAESLVCLLFKNKNTKVHKIIILPVVLYGHETWCLTVEHRLRVFNNNVLRRYTDANTSSASQTNFLHFMKPESSSPHLPGPAACC
jgi:hypothetical protein